MTAADRNTLVASKLDIRFRRSTAGALTDIFGGAENGLNFFLKTVTAQIAANPAFVPSSDAIAYIDASLASGWQGANAVGPPSSWAGHYVNDVLSDTLECVVGA